MRLKDETRVTSQSVASIDRMVPKGKISLCTMRLNALDRRATIEVVLFNTMQKDSEGRASESRLAVYVSRKRLRQYLPRYITNL